MPSKLDEIRDTNGKLPAYAWPGGYPVVYMDKHGETLCPDCANDPAYPGDHDQAVTAWFIHYEGPPEFCYDCNAEIESAYGDPDNEKDDDLKG